MEVLLTIHNLVRWVVAITAVVVLVKYIIGWLGKSQFTSLDANLGRAFAGVMTVQFLLGIITLVTFAASGAFNPGKQMEHALYGLVATALSHMTGMFRKQEDAARFRNSALLILVALLVIFWSVTRLRGSFFFAG